MHEKFQFFALKIHSLAKEVTARHVYFSVQGLQTCFLTLLYRGEKHLATVDELEESEFFF